MPHPPCIHLWSNQEAISPPQTSPLLTSHVPPGTPLPQPEHRQLSLLDQLLKVESQKATAPPAAFCPDSFPAAPAKTLLVALVFAPLMTMVHQLEHRLWSATRDLEKWNPTHKVQRQPLVSSGIADQTSPLSRKTNLRAITEAQLSIECHRVGSLALAVIIQEMEAAPPPGYPLPSMATVLPFSLVLEDIPEMRVITHLQAWKKAAPAHSTC